MNDQKTSKLLVVIIAVLLVFPTVPFLMYRYGINSKMQTNKDIGVEIKPGESVSEISTTLKDAGVINSPFLFKVYLKVNGLEKNIQAGVYTIPKKSSIVELANILQYGRNDVEIKFIEGWRVEELGLLLSNELKDFDYYEFVNQAKPLEGYLFPDTYIFNIDASVKEVISILRDNFEAKTNDLLTGENLEKTGLNKQQAIILASLLEREVPHKEDRQVVAGVLLKRLNEGIKLDVDATTQYAIASENECNSIECLEEVVWWPNNLTKDDLDSDSPYNTRKVMGLPPAPISSFGRSALDAVINYKNSPYYFYLSDKQGNTRFSETYEQHLKNVATYLN